MLFNETRSEVPALQDKEGGLPMADKIMAIEQVPVPQNVTE